MGITGEILFHAIVDDLLLIRVEPLCGGRRGEREGHEQETLHGQEYSS